MHVIVQLNTYTTLKYRYLHLDRLSAALTGDPDLSATPYEFRPKLCSHCTFVQGVTLCLFARLGKVKFMHLAYQHCAFINSDSESFPGSLVHTTETKEKGFLAFLKLVGTAYFSKYRSFFPFDSSRTFLNSVASCSDSKTQHKEWLEFITTTIWEHTEFEDELPPSVEALWRRFDHAGCLTIGVKL